MQNLGDSDWANQIQHAIVLGNQVEYVDCGIVYLPRFSYPLLWYQWARNQATSKHSLWGSVYPSWIRIYGDPVLR